MSSALDVSDITFTLDQAALDRLLKASDGPVGSVVASAGQRVLAGAQSRAPVATGALRGSLSVRHGHDAKGEPQSEVTVRAPYWFYVEYGTRYVRPRSFMRAALRQENR